MSGPAVLQAVLLAALLSACASVPPVERASGCVAAGDLPAPYETGDGQQAINLSVLIYNVEGLPWPARSGRGKKLDKIAAALTRLHEAGQAPDIVMLQEVFSRRAHVIPRRAPYPNVAPGPGVRDRRSIDGARLPAAFLRERRFFKGEKAGKLLGSGLYVMSRYPVIEHRAEPFSRNACAGFDCLSNKGALFVRVAVPGLPSPVDLFTTHMNAKAASGVPPERTLDAHAFQTDESALFLNGARDLAHPLIFGGDFNMKNAQDRLDYFDLRKPYRIVRRYCTIESDACDVRMSWDGDEPWLDTQDLQGFDDGEAITVRPAIVEAMFDKPENGGLLSDHDGYLVTYRLTFAPREDAGLVARARAAGKALCREAGGGWRPADNGNLSKIRTIESTSN
jgi:endonuclease/exonuclease/phosphatase family metal-dependent hydrolase